ncbi:Icl2p [Saccharomyces cerevisiae x Saccharomyces kudriavzevii VIN7]|uniref:methylisocitrate lyase n=1 Tax=Saccharomyces cerevisiae x Saccharomyces kudriavzevii (strain VIN7) TaxID=1095631 RepID=H0H2A0_SACCK|nr:Icl2p [Saccharomyces cerevisiae x Saccharomyces kudriavzevii VIN7]
MLLMIKNKVFHRTTSKILEKLALFPDKSLRRHFSKARSAEDFISSESTKVDEWWASSRFENVSRPYSATDVVKHRGSMPAKTSVYPSSYQARKLFNLLEENFKRGTPLHTLGVIDPVQMSQLARCEGIKVAYISGWACSSTLVGSTNEVSPDFGDYPYDTVPNQVERIFKAQQMHDRKAFLEVSIRGSTPVDYLQPIIADADMGHGGPTTVMKVAKLFAEKGAAGIHLEDQMVGGKRCGHLSGAVLVPTATHLMRLISTRFQWDIMGTENLLIARTDSCNGNLLSSSSDPRDHEFIKGIIRENVVPWSEKLIEMEDKKVSTSTISDMEQEWYQENELFTFEEAIAKQCTAGEFKKYNEKKDDLMTNKLGRSYLSLREMKLLAQEIAPSKKITFDWDAPRTKEGYYMFKGCIEAAIRRSLVFAPYSDMIWLETKTPDLEQARSFSSEIHKYFPATKLVYNLSPSFNWSAHGFDDKALKSFIWDLAKEGFTLQLVSLAGLHSDGVSFWELASSFQTDGMKAYVEKVQRREKKSNCDILTHQLWSGAEYVDSLMKVVQNGASSQTLSTSGESFTETQF